MARRYRKKCGGSRSKKLPLAIVIPAAIPMYNAGRAALSGDMNAVLWHSMGYGTGGFNGQQVMKIAAPIVGGVVLHKFAGRFVNRYIPKWLPVSI